MLCPESPDQATENVPPESVEGAALAASPDSCIACAPHCSAVPVWPLPVAVEPVNDAVPKSASDTGWQLPAAAPPWHTDGASAIHSADEVSGESIWRVLLKLLPVVWAVSAIATWSPFTPTEADMWSPGLTSRSTLTGAAGTSSYHALYSGEPPEQSTAVPVCSSALDSEVAPPMPTQNTASPPLESQLAWGWTQLPETFENCAPVAA